MTFFIGTPHTHNSGYYVNDKDLRTRQEADIKTCTHCQAIIKMQEWKHKGAWCHKCFAPVCHSCGTRMQTYGCEPFMKKLDQFMEASMKHKFDDLLKMAGQETPVSPTIQIFTG